MYHFALLYSRLILILFTYNLYNDYIVSLLLLLHLCYTSLLWFILSDSIFFSYSLFTMFFWDLLWAFVIVIYFVMVIYDLP